MQELTHRGISIDGGKNFSSLRKSLREDEVMKRNNLNRQQYEELCSDKEKFKEAYDKVTGFSPLKVGVCHLFDIQVSNHNDRSKCH